MHVASFDVGSQERLLYFKTLLSLPQSDYPCHLTPLFPGNEARTGHTHSVRRVRARRLRSTNSACAGGGERKALLIPSGASASYETVAEASIGGVTSGGLNTVIGTPGPPLPNKRILYRVTATGTVSNERSAHWSNDPARANPEPGSHGPAGYEGSGPNGPTCYAAVTLGSTGYYGGESWTPSCLGSPPGTAVGHVYLAGATTLGRGGASNAGQWDCHSTSAGYGPCNTWTDDGQTIKIERVVATLTVEPAALTVDYGKTATITAAVSPSEAGGKQVEWTIDASTWSPTVPNPPCNWNNFQPASGALRSCTGVFKRSSTLTVRATVNGEVHERTVQVTVKAPKLTVTATPGLIAGPRVVTFKATLENGGGTWYPAWTYTPGSGLSSPCAWNNNPCVRTVSATGKMIVTTTFDGYALADTAEVTVTPCATGDSILDNVDVRRRLREELIQSGVDSAPSDRREQGGYIFLAPDGTIVVLKSIALNSACGVYKGRWVPPGVPAGSALLGTFHTHPLSEDDVVDCPTSTGVRDTTVTVRFAEDFGHAQDWILNPYRVPEFVITKDGWVYRLDYPAPADVSGGTPHRWRWDQGPGSACTWNY